VQSILADIGALLGVTGSFICGRDGALVAQAMPAASEEAGLSAIGRTLMQTFTGLEVDRHKRPAELDLVFKGGVLLTRNFGSGCLCVLCSRQANVAMVNMTANMAVRKLKDLVGTASPAVPSLATPPAVPAPVAAPGGSVVAPALVTKIEHELARLVGPVAILAVDDAAAAMGYTRQTLPASALSAWIERLATEVPGAAKRAQFVQVARKLGDVE
jgi:predicted regulator of Ras-like GTPase activity (Roadblock/LC7/MglB family)